LGLGLGAVLVPGLAVPVLARAVPAREPVLAVPAREPVLAVLAVPARAVLARVLVVLARGPGVLAVLAASWAAWVV
jgi:hypothetical protein